MRSKRGFEFRAAWLCGAALLLAGERIAADEYGIEEAVAFALAHSPRLAAAGEQAGAAEARVQAAQSARWPQVQARYLGRRSTNPLDAFADKLNTRTVDPTTDFSAETLNHPGASSLHNTGIVLEWPVYRGGRARAEIQQARRNFEAAGFNRERLRAVVAYETQAAYRRAQAARAAVEIAAAAVRAAERHARTTAQLLAQNRIVPSDRLTADVNLALLRGQLSRAESRSRMALTDLKRVMGLDFDAALGIAPWDPAVAVPALAQLEAYEEAALARRRDLAAQRALIAAGRSQTEIARARSRPQVSVFAAENWYDDQFGLGTSATTVGASVTFSLYDAGRDRAQERAARHETNAREYELRALLQQVRQEVRDAYDAVEEARSRVAIAGDNADKAERTVALVRMRYGEGRTILIDLLQTERLLIEARTEKLAAALDLVLAVAALELAGGTLDPRQ